MYLYLPITFSLSIHLSILAIVNNAAVNMEGKYLCQILISILLDKCPELGSLDHTVILSLFNILEKLCAVFHSGYTILYFHQWYIGFSMLYILTYPCYFTLFVDNSSPDRCGVISCGFDLHLPDDWCWWISLHIPMRHLCILFGDVIDYDFLTLSFSGKH